MTEDFYNQRGNYRPKVKLDSVLASMAMNIAKGTERSSKKGFCEISIVLKRINI